MAATGGNKAHGHPREFFRVGQFAILAKSVITNLQTFVSIVKLESNFVSAISIPETIALNGIVCENIAGLAVEGTFIFILLLSLIKLFNKLKPELCMSCIVLI